MPDIAPTAPVTSTGTSATDDEAQMLTLALSMVFEKILKKPEADDDEAPPSAGINEVNKMIGFALAQSVTGFGL